MPGRSSTVHTTIMTAFAIRWVLVVSMLVALLIIDNAGAFTASPVVMKFDAASTRALFKKHRILVKNSQDDESSEIDFSTKQSLEDKMKGWEASEEEIKASTLGGVGLPSGGRSDAFDIGLFIAFPFMVLASLAFAFFPFIIDKIDVSSVGPPPTV